MYQYESNQLEYVDSKIPFSGESFYSIAIKNAPQFWSCGIILMQRFSSKLGSYVHMSLNDVSSEHLESLPDWLSFISFFLLALSPLLLSSIAIFVLLLLNTGNQCSSTDAAEPETSCRQQRDRELRKFNGNTLIFPNNWTF